MVYPGKIFTAKLIDIVGQFFRVSAPLGKGNDTAALLYTFSASSSQTGSFLLPGAWVMPFISIRTSFSMWGATICAGSGER